MFVNFMDSLSVKLQCKVVTTPKKEKKVVSFNEFVKRNLCLSGERSFPVT